MSPNINSYFQYLIKQEPVEPCDAPLTILGNSEVVCPLSVHRIQTITIIRHFKIISKI